MFKPPAPYVPQPPPNPATFANADVQAAGLNKAQQSGLGYASTIATSPGGTSPTPTAGKQLTGV